MKKLFYILMFVFLTVNHASSAELVAPHNYSSGVYCQNCHTFSGTAGPHSTAQPTNSEVCLTCHHDSQPNDFPFDQAYKNYTVGLSGHSHKWNVYTSNPTYGARAPSTSGLLFASLGSPGSGQEGMVVCSTCHDQHGGMNIKAAGRRHLFDKKVENFGGTGTLTFTPVDGALPMGYVVEIVDGGDETTATYKLSYHGTTSSFWFAGTGAAWEFYTGANPRPVHTTDKFLSILNRTQLKFSAGTYVAGEQWKFYFSYPYLRTYPDVGDNSIGRKLCRDCHADRAQNHFSAGNVWDGKMKSHPVGVPLNANGGGYDRKPLDVDGLQQGTSFDNNSTNDLLLFQGITSMTTFGNMTSGDVQCMTCHAPHFTDSNSMTKDLR